MIDLTKKNRRVYYRLPLALFIKNLIFLLLEESKVSDQMSIEIALSANENWSGGYSQL